MKKNSQNLDFLLEIFTEEIPARLVNELGTQLESNFLDELDKNSINYSDINLISNGYQFDIKLINS